MLIVLEGLDGSGKSTQLALLQQWLAQQGNEPLTIKLPDYDDDSSVLVRQYLAGRFGDQPGDVNAYAASMFYAVDRYANYKLKWAQAHADGRAILADRYTTSNAYHQASKLAPEQWADYFAWLEDTEYHKLGLPKPDLVLYLDMPTALSHMLTGKRGAQDIHESATDYLALCRKAALAAAEHYGWHIIPCAHDGAIRSIDEIHAEIVRWVGERVA